MSQPVAAPKVSPRAGSKRLLPHFLVVVGLFALGIGAVFYSQASPASQKPAGAQLRSSGLGLTKSEWESKHQFARIDTAEYRRYIYDYKETLYKQTPSDEGTIWSTGYYVTYWADTVREVLPESRIRTITWESPKLMLQDELGISLDDPMPLARWRAEFLRLMPDDAKYIKTINHPQFLEEKFHSTTLAKLYENLVSAPTPWHSKPGSINVIYTNQGGTVHVEADLVYVYPPTATAVPHYTPTWPAIPTSLATRVWVPRPVPSNMPAPQPTQGKPD
jgi:hypothetical protein